jgi:hypothetical protein
MTVTTKTAYEAVRAHEAIRRDAHEFVDLQPGDAYPQGDVNICRIDKAPKKAAAYAGRQLAPGDTQGSRHIAEGDVELYTPDADAAIKTLHRLFPKTKSHEVQFLGPIVKARGEWTAAHPEHGWRSFPAGVYQVVYQRSFAAVDQEIRRQMD